MLANGFCSKCEKVESCLYKIDARTLEDELKIGYGIPIYIPGIDAPKECQQKYSKDSE